MYRFFLLLVLLNVATLPSEVAGTQLARGVVQTQCKFQDQTNAAVEYVSMTSHGRKIFGGVVPYGKLWEMGEQRAPTFLAGADLLVDGQELPAGRYNLVAIPNLDRWTLLFQKVNGQSKSALGTGETAKVELRVKKLPLAREDFTIQFDQFRGGCLLSLRWEDSEVSALVARK